MFCCSNSGSKLDKKINKEIRNAAREKNKTHAIKTLLLGASDSGKSTLTKQMKILFQSGYTSDERRIIIPSVHANVLVNIQTILKEVYKKLPQDMQELASSVLNTPSSEPWTPDLVGKLKGLLLNSEVQQILEEGVEAQLYKNMDLLSRIDEFASPTYIPTNDDILRVKISTTGITEIDFELDGANFTMLDMGGQRSERRKWISCFDNISAVVFMLALDEYDLRLRGNIHITRMQECLNLFKEVINSQFFQYTTIILFLNKKDLFAEKIQRSDLQECFEDYTGGPSYDNAINFIGEKFRSCDTSKNRSIFVHPICATDTENVNFVLNDVKQILTLSMLRAVG